MHYLEEPCSDYMEATRQTVVDINAQVRPPASGLWPVVSTRQPHNPSTPQPDQPNKQPDKPTRVCGWGAPARRAIQEPGGDILVFLTGQEEVEAMVTMLNDGIKPYGRSQASNTHHLM